MLFEVRAPRFAATVDCWEVEWREVGWCEAARELCCKADFDAAVFADLFFEAAVFEAGVFEAVVFEVPTFDAGFFEEVELAECFEAAVVVVFLAGGLVWASHSDIPSSSAKLAAQNQRKKTRQSKTSPQQSKDPLT